MVGVSWVSLSIPHPMPHGASKRTTFMLHQSMELPLNLCGILLCGQMIPPIYFDIIMDQCFGDNLIPLYLLVRIFLLGKRNFCSWFLSPFDLTPLFIFPLKVIDCFLTFWHYKMSKAHLVYFFFLKKKRLILF